jgi:hypothetical protein
MIEYILLALFIALLVLEIVGDTKDITWTNSKAYNDLNTTTIERNDTD